MKTTPFSTLTGGHIMETLRIHSGLENLRIEIREEA